MANHPSAKKRMRQSETRRLSNHYYARTMRKALKSFRGTTERSEAEKLYPSISSMLDKLVKKKVIHRNKASNLKSSMDKHLTGLS
jgi:small subunit ribosomal protein S20